MENVKISKHILERLFESPLKIKMLKLFLRNEYDQFSFDEIKTRLLADQDHLQQELEKLAEISFIKITKNKTGEQVYSLNHSFIFFQEIQNLIFKSSPADEDKLTRQIQGLGNIKLAVLSGVFMSRTDILIVTDSMSNRKFNSFIKELEAETGVEINYTLLTTKEYEYRTEMFDRFLMDVLEKPHKVLLQQQL